PGLARQRAQGLVPSRPRQKQVQVIGERRLGENDSDVAWLQGPPQTIDVVELRDSDLPRGRLPQAPQGRDELAVLQVDQTLVEVAVIMTVDPQSDLATGGAAGHPDRFDVRLTRRQGELPEWHRIPAGELFGDL